jgi:hypothetical protein
MPEPHRKGAKDAVTAERPQIVIKFANYSFALYDGLREDGDSAGGGRSADVGRTGNEDDLDNEGMIIRLVILITCVLYSVRHCSSFSEVLGRQDN